MQKSHFSNPLLHCVHFVDPPCVHTKLLYPIQNCHDKRLISGCAPKIKPSTSIGGMSLGMDQKPYDKQTAKPTNSQTEERANPRGQTNVNEGRASMCRVDRCTSH